MVVLMKTRTPRRIPILVVQRLLTWSRLGQPIVGDGAGSSMLDPHVRRHLDLVAFLAQSRVDHAWRILDVGCGKGGLAIQLRTAGYRHVEGVDWLEVAALSPEARTALTAYAQADLNREGLARYVDASFDTVLCSDVIEHLENPASILREMARVVRPGGSVFLTYPNAFNIFERLIILLTGNSSRFRVEQPGEHGHISMFTDNVIASLSARAGLKIRSEGRGYCMFANTMILPRRVFGPRLSFVRYLELTRAA